MPTISFPRFSGSSRKLVLAFDVGTTFSGVTYAILEPGEVPKIQNVLRYPGQGAGDFKVPSVLWYTKEGTVYAAGAEAADERVGREAEAKNLVFVEFKMHLFPESLSVQQGSSVELKPLPADKCIMDVVSDFLKYLFDCTRSYIVDAHPQGETLWKSLEDDIDIVLSHPNGFEGAQLALMRGAAVMAGLIPDTDDGSSRLSFISEGEASVHFCIHLGLASDRDAIKAGTSVTVVDAGGGTVDISSYRFKGVDPIVLEEITAAQCLLQGSTIVNTRAEKFLRKKLTGSKFNNDAEISAMVEVFEKVVKPKFKDADEKFFLKFGGVRDVDLKYNVTNGQMKLEGSDVKEFFKTTVTRIVAAVRSQKDESENVIPLVFLVGGFSASPWLLARLKLHLNKDSINISRPDTHMNKAVAEGALVHYLSHLVAARVARLTIGTVCGTDFDEADPEHVKRKDQCKHRPSGVLTVPGKFIPLVLKGTRLGEDDVSSRTMCREHQGPKPESEAAAYIVVYRGTKANPEWIDEEPEHFQTLCTISADTSDVESVPHYGVEGEYFVQQFDIVLECGKTELNAYLRWQQEGEEKRGNAKIVYDENNLQQ